MRANTGPVRVFYSLCLGIIILLLDQGGGCQTGRQSTLTGEGGASLLEFLPDKIVQ